MLTLNSILTPAQYAQSLAEDRQRADAVAAYLRVPHPDKTPDEQPAVVLQMHPSLMLTRSVPELEATRWLKGT